MYSNYIESQCTPIISNLNLLQLYPISMYSNYGVENKLLNVIQSYLINRQQYVLLNGRVSKLDNILAGVPQGSVLGPLLFLIYKNNLPNGL